MSKYLIHTIPERRWYVDKYLVPSMIAQGIAENNVTIYEDRRKRGNLKSFLISCGRLPVDGGTWHLQDDVLICSDFKERTEKYDSGLVCGFSSYIFDGELQPGEVHPDKMWYSFPCIRIPNNIAHECVDWIQSHIIGNPNYREWWENGTNDDWMFKEFMKYVYSSIIVLNLSPNLVQHIDWLIGGSSICDRDSKSVISQYWNEDYLVKEFEHELNEQCSRWKVNRSSYIKAMQRR